MTMSTERTVIQQAWSVSAAAAATLDQNLRTQQITLPDPINMGAGASATWLPSYCHLPGLRKLL